MRAGSNVKLDSVKGDCIKIHGRYVTKRSADTLRLQLLVDNAPLRLNIPAKKSFVYWENIASLGIGFLIDRKTEKRFTYPKRIFIEKENGNYVSRINPVIRKGTLSLVPALPYFNFFRIKTDRDFLNSGGFIGLGLGVEYAFKKNQYISLNGGVTFDFPYPFPAPIRYSGEYHKAEIQYASLRYHKCHGRLDFGYGLHFSHSYYMGYVRSKSDSINFEMVTRENIGMGLSLSLRYLTFRRFGIGLVYQPSFIGFYPSGFGYQHLITIELILRLRWVSPD